MTKKGRAIYLVYTDLIDDKYDAEFNAWYNTQHLPQLRAIPGILDAARYVAVKGGPKYLAVYELDSVDVLRSDAFVNRPREQLNPTARQVRSLKRPSSRKGRPGRDRPVYTPCDRRGQLAVGFVVRWPANHGPSLLTRDEVFFDS